MYRAYIKISNIELGDYPCSDNSELILSVGPHNKFQDNEVKFPTRDRGFFENTWHFAFTREERSAFVVVLYKHHLPINREIGEIELRLDAFQPNTVVSDVFALTGTEKDWMPAKLRITVHVDENGAPPFSAPEGFEFPDKAEVKHKKTYSHWNPTLLDP